MFITETDPAILVITSIMVGDAGLFRCRVDFKANQTQNSYVKVSVIGTYSIVSAAAKTNNNNRAKS
jgi:hypothetical protein